MTTTRPLVAIVPFGAKGRDAKAGGIGRQVARRLVERFAENPNVELRPVFLVAMPEAKSDAGYLVFGSTPDPDLAARYGESLGTTHTLTGLYREDPTGRAFAVSLVDVRTRAVVAQNEIVVGPNELHRAEPALAAWLAEALGVPTPGLAPETANEPSYQAFLAGLEDETNATLLRAGNPSAADEARARAFNEYVAAIHLDPESLRAEDRLLVLAAESVERGDEDRAARSLEDVVESKPRSWRAHYMRAELLRHLGEANMAIVALEHAHALRPLRDVDVVVLAELYLAEGAPGQAASHLRRIAADSAEFGRAQELLGILAFGKGDQTAARAYFERAAANGRLGARAHLARVLIATGLREDASRELDAVLSTAAADPDALAQARRLRLGLDRPELEAELERAGRAALSAEVGRLGEVRAAFERVLAFDPEIWEAHFGVGLAARRTEDFVAAAVSFRRALELAPEQPDVMHELGVALLASGSKADALGFLDRAAALRPGQAAYIADAGFAHLRAGDIGAARERLRIASTIDADDPLTRAYLAELERVEAASGKAN
ncbi:MAG TPA: tetratricopeptide repeat protein [Candidatus Bathyarchaeia archaeon]|nr:tetratricopeptide repeat protein [Candidatus Bathyarchaeia archaeon]